MHDMNLVWRKVASELFPKTKFLAIENMSVLRGDAHYGIINDGDSSIMDCVHFCNPGPVDTWSDLLFGGNTTDQGSPGI